MNLKISVKNFGPIKEGKVELNDLNVFIGSNNAGKSYFATLVYTLLQSLSFSSKTRRIRLLGISVTPRFLISKPRHAEKINSLISTSSKDILDKIITTYESEQEVSVDKQLLEPFYNATLDEFLTEFTTNLKRNMTSNLEDIVRFGAQFFEIRISIGNDFIEFINEKNNLKIKNSKLTWRDIRFTRREALTKSNENLLMHGENIYRRGKSVMIILSKTQMARLFKPSKEGNLKTHRYSVDEFNFFLTDALEQAMPDLFNAPRVFYLPAARSGILQAHRIIAANAVQLSPFFGINRIEIPQMSGTIADFLTLILAIDLERSGLPGISKEFEKQIIHGHVDLKGKDQLSLTEIIYEFKKHKIPLNRASSTVSELAPLFLLLKHVIREGNMVIIEEPEAHLHPANQKLLAKLINVMVTKKVQLLITTHSDFLLPNFLTAFIHYVLQVLIIAAHRNM